MTALAARGVAVHFGGVAALAGATVEVADDEIVGLIGPNGAGKTTLVNVMAGLQRPDEGRVELGGRDITGFPPHERAKLGLRRMFQYGGLVPDETVLTNVLIAHHVVDVADARGRSHDLLSELGVADDAHRLVRDLPAGRARLVELACVLAGEPSVMLLDEPSTGLGSHEAAALADTIRRHASDGRAVLVVAHDMRFVMGLAGRIVVLADGEVIAQGTPDDVRSDARVRELYLGTRP